MPLSLFDLLNPGNDYASPSGAAFGDFADSQDQLSPDPRDHEGSLAGYAFGRLTDSTKKRPPLQYNKLGVPVNARTAEQTEAALMYARYNAAKPQMDELRNSLLADFSNPDAQAEVTQEASGRAMGAFDRSLSSAKNSLSASGQLGTAGQQGSFERQSKLARGLASIGAKNQATAGLESRRMNVGLG